FFSDRRSAVRRRQRMDPGHHVGSYQADRIQFLLPQLFTSLHLFSYMLDHAIAGLSPYAFHLSNNLWAGLVAVLVYLIALALTQHRLTAVAAAVLFVAHPVHVEAVAWISSRKDLIAAVFLLPSFLVYLKYRQCGAIACYLVSLLLFLFALL